MAVLAGLDHGNAYLRRDLFSRLPLQRPLRVPPALVWCNAYYRSALGRRPPATQLVLDALCVWGRTDSGNRTSENKFHLVDSLAPYPRQRSRRGADIVRAAAGIAGRRRPQKLRVHSCSLAVRSSNALVCEAALSHPS